MSVFLQIKQPALVHNTTIHSQKYETLEEALADLREQMDDITHPAGKFWATIHDDASDEYVHEQFYEVDL